MSCVCLCVCLSVCLSVCKVLLWVCVYDCTSRHSSSEGWNSQSMSFTTLPTMQCKMVDTSITTEVKMRGKQLVWMSPPNPTPRKVYLFLNCKSLWVSVSSVTKGKTKPKRYLASMMESFTVTYCYHGFGNHTAVPLCLLCRKGKLQQEQIHHRVKREVWDGRLGTVIGESMSVQVKSSKNDTIWNIYNVIIYDILMSEVTANLLFPVSFLWRIKKKKKTL